MKKNTNVPFMEEASWFGDILEPHIYIKYNLTTLNQWGSMKSERP